MKKLNTIAIATICAVPAVAATIATAVVVEENNSKPTVQEIEFLLDTTNRLYCATGSATTGYLEMKNNTKYRFVTNNIDSAYPALGFLASTADSGWVSEKWFDAATISIQVNGQSFTDYTIIENEGIYGIQFNNSIAEGKVIIDMDFIGQNQKIAVFLNAFGF